VARPLYFPVKAEPLRMQAGLFRFGTDFGNGEADQRYFPRDESGPRYLAAKARILSRYPERDSSVAESEGERACLRAARAWFFETLSAERQDEAARASTSELGRHLMEDFAVVHRAPDGNDRVLWLHACFPSGWRPSQVIGQSFTRIHSVIPGSEALIQKAPSLVEAMVGRGPYVRFVWTLSADDELDHHPEQGARLPWSETTARAFLRVERQTLVPLPNASGSVFLIRTYLYELAELSREQRRTLALALAQMPPAIAAYKGLTEAIPRALSLLGERAAPASGKSDASR
jgi:dimethylamine monooxygenase subunit A